MGLVKDLKDCEGCAKRREQMLAAMHRFTDWVKDPRGKQSPMRIPSLPVVQTSGPRPRPAPRGMSVGLTPTPPTDKKDGEAPIPNE